MTDPICLAVEFESLQYIVSFELFINTGKDVVEKNQL